LNSETITSFLSTKKGRTRARPFRDSADPADLQC
jgi:hypothetical protein